MPVKRLAQRPTPVVTPMDPLFDFPPSRPSQQLVQAHHRWARSQAMAAVPRPEQTLLSNRGAQCGAGGVGRESSGSPGKIQSRRVAGRGKLPESRLRCPGTWRGQVGAEVECGQLRGGSSTNMGAQRRGPSRRCAHARRRKRRMRRARLHAPHRMDKARSFCALAALRSHHCGRMAPH